MPGTECECVHSGYTYQCAFMCFFSKTNLILNIYTHFMHNQYLRLPHLYTVARKWRCLLHMATQLSCQKTYRWVRCRLILQTRWPVHSYMARQINWACRSSSLVHEQSLFHAECVVCFSASPGRTSFILAVAVLLKEVVRAVVSMGWASRQVQARWCT